MEVLTIEDSPRFPYRGIHIDVARNFLKKETILKMLDLMAFYKINTLHFHLTDDEGWRIEIKELPELTEIGGKREHASSIDEPVFIRHMDQGLNHTLKALMAAAILHMKILLKYSDMLKTDISG